ncbi:MULTISPECIES: sensor histidine kinase [Syntrophotalea]|uniref:histidine kinase n=1 Tax=Syntrophotalea acetylenica TaxID=29542 RepID=A0A1L3GDV2_SYNAC|nr:HAMP domain-containing sensor histidine kinase [Syntrophotalea acetylenica]APG24134.1 two-component sensor histidine kinase [Syntrophotalea acetylenica]APG44716.1 two-component sensor histidine kinase [Syntrophotalea acetylenica]MDY0262882.1 HAMP domain-containing sensor histidine kinase [Syntrophotalea acetylenica]
MKTWRRIFNPLMALIGIQLAWVLVVVSWVTWFLQNHRKLRSLAEKYHPELLLGRYDWLLLVEGLVLLVAILAGVYVIFIYWRRQVSLYRAQKQFISQVSHELKSPLASLQLHLETIRMRQPDPDRLQAFLDTMLEDTVRLNNMVDNMLTANRLEQRWPRLDLRLGNLSAAIEQYLEGQSATLPADCLLETAIEPELFCYFEPLAIETILRNLLENAILYANGKPRIRVELHKTGNRCHLTVADHGRGIDPKEQKKVFRMFYRGWHDGETIRGSGLGLFIVRTLVWRHRGKVWLESKGRDQGTTVHILLPRSLPPAGAGTL